jgi:hypothetical protein
MEKDMKKLLLVPFVCLCFAANANDTIPILNTVFYGINTAVNIFRPTPVVVVPATPVVVVPQPALLPPPPPPVVIPNICRWPSPRRRLPLHNHGSGLPLHPQ